MEVTSTEDYSQQQEDHSLFHPLPVIHLKSVESLLL